MVPNEPTTTPTTTPATAYLKVTFDRGTQRGACVQDPDNASTPADAVNAGGDITVPHVDGNTITFNASGNRAAEGGQLNKLVWKFDRIAWQETPDENGQLPATGSQLTQSSVSDDQVVLLDDNENPGSSDIKWEYTIYLKYLDGETWVDGSIDPKIVNKGSA